MSKQIKIKEKANDTREAIKIVAPDDDFNIETDIAADNPQKLAVFGSRSIIDARAKMVINETLQQYGTITTIVTTQEPRGVCEVAQATAKENSLILELHFLNFRNGRGAFCKRSDEVIKASDYVLLIHDGISHGTKNELEYTKKSGKPYRYVTMQPSNVYVDRDEGINCLKDEQ